MATLVCFHAHPDDEAIATGGLMAKAAAAGHRVILVTATRGEQGEPVEGVLEEGEALGDRRVKELVESAQILGAEEPILLGYVDSGMMGEPENDNPDCFWQADEDEAAERLAGILQSANADVLTIYDNHGGYGHPDYLRVHSVGLKAAALAGTEIVLESTMNRNLITALLKAAAAAGDEFGDPENQPTAEEFDGFGTPESDIAYSVDVGVHIDQKRRSMMAHRSQIGPDSFFLSLPEEAFAMSFGSEWFNRPGETDTGGPVLVELLPGLE